MSSELLRELRVRVDAHLRPHVQIYGPEAPTVKMALLILAEAEDIEGQLLERRMSTNEASERTGWAPETLQKYARAKLAGDEMPAEWSGLIVEQVSGAYAFVLGSIPQKPSRAD